MSRSAQLRRIMSKFGRWVKRPERLGNIAMFHVGRSGSTVVTQLLAQHKSITWDGELLRGPNLLNRTPPDSRPLQPYAASKWFPFAPAEFVRQRVRRPASEYYGFETKFYHVVSNGMSLEGYLEMLELLEFHHYIILRRENLLRKIVSSIILNQSGQSHLAQGEASLKQVVVDLDKIEIDRRQGSLLSLLDEWQAHFANLDRLLSGKNVLRLSYERDVVENPKQAASAICDWLGISPPEGDVKLRRTNPFPLRDMIVNADDVERALSGTAYAWMLRDELPESLKA